MIVSKAQSLIFFKVRGLHTVLAKQVFSLPQPPKPLLGVLPKSLAIHKYSCAALHK